MMFFATTKNTDATSSLILYFICFGILSFTNVDLENICLCKYIEQNSKKLRGKTGMIRRQT